MKMDTPNEKGVSLRATLLQVYRDSGIVDPLLEDEPQAWECGKHILEWFWDLSAGRSIVGLGMAGGAFAPLSYTEIQSWATLSKIDLSPWEVNAIKSLDSVYLAEQNKKLMDRPKTKGS